MVHFKIYETYLNNLGTLVGDSVRGNNKGKCPLLKLPLVDRVKVCRLDRSSCKSGPSHRSRVRLDTPGGRRNQFL